MIFTMDVGNTNIKTALFEGREMRNYWRISTNTSYTSDEYGLILEGLFARAGLSLDAVEGIVMSSVSADHQLYPGTHVQELFRQDAHDRGARHQDGHQPQV